MGSGLLDRRNITAKEGSSSKQSSALVTLQRSAVIGNLGKCQSEDENQVEASQVVRASNEYCGTKAQLLSSGNSEEPISSNYSDASLNVVKEVVPRVGENYQVEVPAHLSHSEQYLSTIDDQNVAGLTLPVVWVQLEESYHSKDQRSECTNLHEAKISVKSKDKKKSQLGHKKSSSKTNFMDVQEDHKKDTPLAKLGNKLEDEAQLHKMNERKSHFLVPEIQYKSWNDADMDNFLLGLHIFGKNFAQIKRFIENKSMGDILSFYYGKFCGSNMHRRWSDCIKGRNTKRAWGKKLFSGWRQQELISRLLPNVTEENQNKLLEVSKLFNEEGISLEEYAFSLKTIAGLSNIAEAVGAGKKGKKDLTGVAMAPVCPKIPKGKACFSLETSVIIRILTGGFRLSIRQRNDIFWEAVWPRLLARGWNSEQSGNQRYVGSRSYMVFLKPGVESFSRKKLVKGDDYYDSVTDMLKKVAAEPQLLELEPEKNKNDGLKEVADSLPENSKGDIPDQSPRSLESDIIFTDTSALNKGNPHQLKKLTEDIGDSTAMADDKSSKRKNKLYKGKSRPEPSDVFSTDEMSKRQSTGERSSTTKALEAPARGGFDNVRKRKRSDGTKKRRNTSA